MEGVNPYDVIEYIKNSIEILLNMKDDDYEELKNELVKVRQRENALRKQLWEPNTEEEKSDGNNTFAYEPPSEYEDIIRKLENDVWNQIRLQN